MRSHAAQQLLLGIMITQLDKEPPVRALAAEALLGGRAAVWAAAGWLAGLSPWASSGQLPCCVLSRLRVNNAVCAGLLCS